MTDLTTPDAFAVTAPCGHTTVDWAAADPMAGPIDADFDAFHCQHTVRTNDLEDWDRENDWCVHCECCCTCMGCLYGPPDGMLMFPGGAA